MDKKIELQIYSEIGELDAVLLHKPGKEIEKMTPESAKNALFSDILNHTVINEEYSLFAGVLEKVTNVYYVTDLLAEVLQSDKIKNLFLADFYEKNIPSDITSNLNAQELTKLVIEGKENYIEISDFFQHKSERLLNHAEKNSFRPAYNLFFTRDSASIIFDNAIIHTMANDVRRNETHIMRAIFNSKKFKKNKTLALPHDKATTEGGDVLVASEDILLIGMGTRTDSEGIKRIINKLAPQCPKHVLVQELPLAPESFIHLDMVFTFLDQDLCMTYEPVIQGGYFKTYDLTVQKGEIVKVEYRKNLIDALNKNGISIKPLRCGGSNRLHQDREQWHSGANFFAFAPGKVIGYERNVYTLEEMNNNGFEIVKAQDVLSGKIEINKIDKVVVTFPGSELARGGGGARCMTMPLTRKPLT